MAQENTNTSHISLNRLISETLSKNASHAAMTDMNTGFMLTYSELAGKMAVIRGKLRDIGVKKGDRVVICGRNRSCWAASFLAAITSGAVAVPVLSDFNPETNAHLIAHCGASAVFIDDSIFKKIDTAKVPTETVFVSLDTIFSLESEPDNGIFEDGRDDLAVINYTSGSMGSSKGVMLSYGNLSSNAYYSISNIPYLFPDDGTLNLLPLAHMFGLLVELIFPLLKGCHIHFLGKTPAPSVLLKALAEVKPKLMIVVPLILEKIIIGKVFPVVNKPFMKFLCGVPGINRIIYGKIRRQLLDVFGGGLQQLISGGAAMNKDVEEFLRKIKFPLTIGYGMTECAPLICYAPWYENKSGSCGRAVDNMELRIDSSDPQNVPGELWVKGANVMMGYYHNEEATAAVMRDGWMNTGDVCVMDSDGFLYIRGRSKCMILGPSGQNIYPEEIESKLSALPFVAENLVVQRDSRLIALVYPDVEKMKSQGVTPAQLSEIMNENLKTLNSSIAKYEQISAIELRDEEFEKTPKRSIKRYLYS